MASTSASRNSSRKVLLTSAESWLAKPRSIMCRTATGSASVAADDSASENSQPAASVRCRRMYGHSAPSAASWRVGRLDSCSDDAVIAPKWGRYRSLQSAPLRLGVNIPSLFPSPPNGFIVWERRPGRRGRRCAITNHFDDRKLFPPAPSAARSACGRLSPKRRALWGGARRAMRDRGSPATGVRSCPRSRNGCPRGRDRRVSRRRTACCPPGNSGCRRPPRRLRPGCPMRASRA